MTVWVSKGLQYPIVYLPFTFNRNLQERDLVLFHDEGARCLHIGGKDSPDFGSAAKLGSKEAAGDDSRLTYVAMTRAQSQVVAWWSPAYGEPNGGLSRLLRGRRPGEPVIPDRCAPPKITDEDAWARLREWEIAGGPVLEESVIRSAPDVSGQHATVRPRHPALPSRYRHRVAAYFVFRSDPGSEGSEGTGTSQAAGVSSEPEVTELDDEVGEIPLTETASGSDMPSPMADLPAGAKFGTLVHAVLETADPLADRSRCRARDADPRAFKVVAGGCAR